MKILNAERPKLTDDEWRFEEEAFQEAVELVEKRWKEDVVAKHAQTHMNRAKDDSLVQENTPSNRGL